MGTTTLRYWDSRSYESRAARQGDPPEETFRAYIPHPIANWMPLLDEQTWLQTTAATQQCLDIQQASHGQLLAEWLLNRAESIASSTIEGIHPSARRVARAEAQLVLFGEQPPVSEMESLRNIDITLQARELAVSNTEMTVAALQELHSTLMGAEDPIAGQIRDRQNWVGAGQLGGPLRAHHVGPPPEAVPELLDDLLAFVNRRDEGMAMVRAAVAHAQFETIHPFPDGNGRTGRALLQYMYLRNGLSSAAALPVSTALMLAKHDYFEALDSTRVICEPDDLQRSQAFQPWISQLAEASEHACHLHDRLSGHLAALQQKWSQTAQEHGIRTSSAAFRLLAHLPTNPIVTSSRVSELLTTTERSARNAVTRLADAGILVQRSAGRRNRAYESPDIMDAFTEAAREQPVGNLTLSPFPPITQPISATDPAASQRLCNAQTVRGRRCRHPKPRPGGKCPAGHKRSV